MKVYIMMRNEVHEGGYVIAVFASLEKAKSFDSLPENVDRDDLLSKEWFITEHDVWTLKINYYDYLTVEEMDVIE